MKKPIVFLDLDGVIVDFITSTLATLGFPNHPIPIGNPHMETWPGMEMSKSEFWRRIDKAGQAFWENLEKYPWTDEMVTMCEQYGDVYILSSPSRNPQCSAGKVVWIGNNLPQLRDKVILTGHKYLCAAPGRVLVDDTELQVNNFRKYGGSAFLFPQRWNSAHGKHRISALETYLQHHTAQHETEK